MAGTDASINVPNTGPAAVDTAAVPYPDGSTRFQQRIDGLNAVDISQIRQLLEQFIVLWSSAQSLPPSMDGRAVQFDESGDLRASLGTSISGGVKVARLIAAATTNATLVKPGAGQVYGWYLFNAAASTRFVKLYNSAAAPKVGTDIPVLTLALPAGAAANVWCAAGIDGFPVGIGLAMTVNAADSDATAVTAGDVILNLFYS